MLSANLVKKKFFLQTFSTKSPKSGHQWSITITHFGRLHMTLSAKLYTNPLKFHSLCRLVPVQWCNLAFFRDSCNSFFAEILLSLRLIYNSLHNRFVMVFCFSFLLKPRHFVTLPKILVHQIEKQKEIVKYKKETFMVFMTL